MTNYAVYNKTLRCMFKDIISIVADTKLTHARRRSACLINEQFKSKSALLSAHSIMLYAMCAVLIGCSTTQPPVPVVDRVKNATPESSKTYEANSLSNQVYTVQKGDTLYGIALNHGIDYKKLVEWNNIRDPNSIRPGQKINLFLPTTVENDGKPTLYSLPQQPITTTIETESQSLDSLPLVSPAATSNDTASGDNVKTGPKAIKLPFSEQNTSRMQQSANSSPAAIQPVPAIATNEKAKIEEASQFESNKADQAGNQSVSDWIWPTDGRVISTFSKNSKGVKISGHAGQAVLASASGVVVYSGNGLRGYGNLIIIKHDDTFLSAYAHNNKLLVKEGEAVTKGQKIAEMGNTDSDAVQLHFEIRKNSKPVDPLEYLPHQS